MNDGWIKLHRKMLTWGWYSDSNTKALFLHLLFHASYEPSEFKGQKIEIGDCIFGRKKWAIELGMSERSLRTALEHLKSTNEVTIKSTNKFSVVTIVNYNKYQCLVDDTDQQNVKQTVKRATNNRPTTDHIKEGNKLINKENKNIYHENVKLFEEEYQKLVDRFGQADADERIERLSMYLFSTGKKYQSHYHTILNWSIKDKQKSQQKQKPDYSNPATYADERNDTFE